MHLRQIVNKVSKEGKNEEQGKEKKKNTQTKRIRNETKYKHTRKKKKTWTNEQGNKDNTHTSVFFCFPRKIKRRKIILETENGY